MDFLEVLFPAIKKKREKEKKRRLLIAITFTFVGLVIGMLGAGAVVYQARNRIPEGITQSWGVTFSKKYADALGLDWRDAYRATLDDLGARKLRIPAYWDEVEYRRGNYEFTDLDWMLNEAHQRGAHVTLVVGRRLPRWPECHDPLWLRGLPETDIKDAQLAYMRRVVERYRAHPAIARWQVENEPFLSTFGICPPPDPKLLQEEVALVRSLDTRPIMVTDSGELSSWIELSHYGDILGVSLYRVVWNEWFGYFYWPLPASYYRKKAELTRYRAKDVIISEVQLEPWTDTPIRQLPIAEQLTHFDEKHFRDTIGYARKTGLSEIYLWGAEWWYWVRAQGHPEFWSIAKELFHENSQ